MKILKKFCQWFKCWHDWEILDYEYVLDVPLKNKICLKCHKKSFKIDECKEYLKNRQEKIEKALEFLREEKNAN